MRTLRAEYNGRACASIVREFESQGGSEPPERHRTEDHRAMYVLPPNVTCDNDGRLHSEHMYGNESRGFYLKDRQAKSQSYRIGLLFHLKGAHEGFETCLEDVCEAYHPLAELHFDDIDGPDLDRALCTMACVVARALGGTFLPSPSWCEAYSCLVCICM